MVTNKAGKGSLKPQIPKSSQSHAGSHADIFWAFVNETAQKTESDRLVAIRNGLSVMLPAGLRDALNIDFTIVAKLLDTSRSTLARNMRSAKPLNFVASERLDRIAQIASMAERVLESREETSQWLKRAHPALSQQAPISLCNTEVGSCQIRRILSAMEWGNAT